MQKKETVQPMEAILFTDLALRPINQSKVSEIKPYLDFIATENNLKLNRLKEFNQAVKILCKSVMWN